MGKYSGHVGLLIHILLEKNVMKELITLVSESLFFLFFKLTNKFDSFKFDSIE
jgi:hypothetical protein